MIADRNWLDFSSQFQGLLKEMKCAIGFPTAPQSQLFDITYCVFQEIFNLGQRRLTVLWQPWTPISSDLQPLSTGLEKSLRFQEDRHIDPSSTYLKSIVLSLHRKM